MIGIMEYSVPVSSGQGYWGALDYPPERRARAGYEPGLGDADAVREQGAADPQAQCGSGVSGPDRSSNSPAITVAPSIRIVRVVGRLGIGDAGRSSWVRSV